MIAVKSVLTPERLNILADCEEIDHSFINHFSRKKIVGVLKNILEKYSTEIYIPENMYSITPSQAHANAHSRKQ
jgi:hypothetical protein